MKRHTGIIMRQGKPGAIRYSRDELPLIRERSRSRLLVGARSYKYRAPHGAGLGFSQFSA